MIQSIIRLFKRGDKNNQSMDFIIVGLGNAGNDYAMTRHNVGWLLLDEILGDQVGWSHDKYAQAMVSKDTLLELLYVKPLTMMNNSGVSVRQLKDRYHLVNEQIIVVYDDIDLPLGKMKVSHNRGSGGHNGIRSIEQHLGASDYTRIRIGISQELENGQVIKPNVLGKFTTEELEKVRAIVPDFKKALHLIVVEGREAAMNVANVKK
jgi:PTH1 family peptidyl-tRNA hydrolase